MKACASNILTLCLTLSGSNNNNNNNNNKLGTISSTKPSIVTWLIDGNNLQCCSASGGMGRMERNEVIQEIQQIASPSSSSSSSSSAIFSLRHDDDDDGNDANPPDIVLTKKQRKLQQRQNSIANVVLVFDGNENEEFQELITNHPWFQVIITDGKGKRKDRADDYIVHHALPQLNERFFEKQQEKSSGSHVVHLVSADKELRKRAIATRMTNGGSVVYPPKFWKQYLPNLIKQQQQ
ncbi:unnamed protein product [Cylindrotheca closterium]|uniref:Uncharacterized protein n=1 Tax=Cylindrotheca closterium TaxID=2856 RepID=A0AAD2JJP4_9STRA|nr:unnamed protein product [Cylindrotheca closterium]